MNTGTVRALTDDGGPQQLSVPADIYAAGKVSLARVVRIKIRMAILKHREGIVRAVGTEAWAVSFLLCLVAATAFVPRPPVVVSAPKNISAQPRAEHEACGEQSYRQPHDSKEIAPRRCLDEFDSTSYDIPPDFFL